MPLLTNLALTIPITHKAREIAEHFASQQPTQTKKEQVYTNSLAVSVVNDYLTWMGISTQREESDSVNPVMQLFEDVGDLMVEGIGRLECRPIREGQSTCPIPWEVRTDRKGYVVVELKDSLLEAVIVGFSPTVDTGELAVEDLRPISELPEYLDSTTHPDSTIVPFSHWLAGVIKEGWQDLNDLLDSLQMQPSVAFRGQEEVLTDEDKQTWGRVIDCGLQMGEQSLVLLISLKPETASTMQVKVTLKGTESYLPPGVSLSVIADGQIQRTVTSRNHDNWIELPKFEGELKETFQIKVVKDELVFSENFVI